MNNLCIFIVCACTWTHTCTCYGTCVEVTRKLFGVGFLLLPCQSLESNLGHLTWKQVLFTHWTISLASNYLLKRRTSYEVKGEIKWAKSNSSWQFKVSQRWWHFTCLIFFVLNFIYFLFLSMFRRVKCICTVYKVNKTSFLFSRCVFFLTQ